MCPPPPSCPSSFPCHKQASPLTRAGPGRCVNVQARQSAKGKMTRSLSWALTPVIWCGPLGLGVSGLPFFGSFWAPWDSHTLPPARGCSHPPTQCRAVGFLCGVNLWEGIPVTITPAHLFPNTCAHPGNRHRGNTASCHLFERRVDIQSHCPTSQP